MKNRLQSKLRDKNKIMNMDTKTQDGEVFEFFNKNKLVCKISGSPFKSGRKINRIKGLVINE